MRLRRALSYLAREADPAARQAGAQLAAAAAAVLDDLAARAEAASPALIATVDERVRWKLVWEFLEEYRWEPAQTQVGLVQAEPPSVGDERWDALVAALAEHLCAQHDLAPPTWTEPRVLRRAWFPAELAIQRADALVRAPAAFRKHGVYLSAHDLTAA